MTDCADALPCACNKELLVGTEATAACAPAVVRRTSTAGAACPFCKPSGLFNLRMLTWDFGTLLQASVSPGGKSYKREKSMSPNSFEACHETGHATCHMILL